MEMNNLRSSWNSDRVAACILCKPAKAVRAKRPVHLFTVYHDNQLKVLSIRRTVKFSAVYRAAIVSAVCTDSGLVVELADGSRYEYSRTFDGVFTKTGEVAPAVSMVGFPGAVSKAA